MELNIHKWIEQTQLIRTGDRIIVAVSGGPDSIALLHWLVHMRKEWNLSLMVAHVNHSLRGEEADMDQKYVEELCQTWKVPCKSVKVDIARFAKEEQLNKQEAARKYRYHYFDTLAKEKQFHKVAVAHHLDDQIETMMMRIIRGAGMKGLTGIPHRRKLSYVEIVRPFIRIKRSEIEAYCTYHQLDPRTDASNLEDHYTRNYIRHRLVPAMQQLNPNLHQACQALQDTLQEEDQYLDQLAQDFLSGIVQLQESQKMIIQLSHFRQQALALQRRVILLLLKWLSVEQTDLQWSKGHIEQILQLASHQEGHGSLHLPGLIIRREYDHLTLQYAPRSPSTAVLGKQSQKEGLGNHERASTGSTVHPLHMNEKIRLCMGDQTLQISVQSYPKEQELKATTIIKGTNKPNDSIREEHNPNSIEYTAYFDQAQLKLPLVVRHRETGDKIQPIGMKGHRKVKDIFIDEKIPIRLRNKWPLIADQNGLVWIPGVKRANKALITDDTEKVIKITVERVGEVQHAK